eukprot:TRINITY_DN42473_c0_g1_i1.p1 TRINITY_DN42473_c0_g1~~TRINITY_DN42473_c0_g1_i1.p1  ORF type:complete len:157 (-),score=5.41 TRINITY_DN42473_c0_g1_i1:33-503(-)
MTLDRDLELEVRRPCSSSLSCNRSSSHFLDCNMAWYSHCNNFHEDLKPGWDLEPVSCRTSSYWRTHGCGNGNLLDCSKDSQDTWQHVYDSLSSSLDALCNASFSCPICKACSAQSLWSAEHSCSASSAAGSVSSARSVTSAPARTGRTATNETIIF